MSSASAVMAITSSLSAPGPPASVAAASLVASGRPGLELEDMTTEQITECAIEMLAHSYTEDVTPVQRQALSMFVLLTMRESPDTTTDGLSARFSAWCEGFGVQEEEFWERYGSWFSDVADSLNTDKGGN